MRNRPLIKTYLCSFLEGNTEVWLCSWCREPWDRRGAWPLAFPSSDPTKPLSTGNHLANYQVIKLTAFSLSLTSLTLEIITTVNFTDPGFSDFLGRRRFRERGGVYRKMTRRNGRLVAGIVRVSPGCHPRSQEPVLYTGRWQIISEIDYLFWVS